MADKIIKTKIKLRQEAFSYWADTTATEPAEKKAGAGEKGYYVPLFGEVCFCEITAANQGTLTDPPTVLFKVGNGKDYFKDLNWASALAADVYDWAKTQEVVLNGEKLEFYNVVDGTKIVEKSVDLSAFNVNVTKLATPTAGYEVTYQITQGGSPVGVNIDVPKGENTAHSHSAGDGLKIKDNAAGGVDGDVKYELNLAFKDDATNKKLQLVDATDNTKVIAEFNTTEFIKDGMIQSVELVDEDADGNEGKFLKITWNIDNALKPEDADTDIDITYVDVTDLLNIYTADEATITLKNGQFAINNGGVDTDQLAAGAVTEAKIDSTLLAELKKDTKTTVTTGDTAGTIKVTVDGTATDVAVKDLKTVATSADAYDLQQANAGKDKDGNDIQYFILDCNW